MHESVAKLGPTLTWMSDGADFFEDALSSVTESDLRDPSLLPGWSRAHVLAHVGFNAQALGRLVTWARTGLPHAMYSNPDQRADEIERGSSWTLDRLRDHVSREQSLLSAALEGLTAAQWQTDIRTAQGRTLPASEIPWLRSRELWIHAVDLGGKASFDAFPTQLLLRLVDEALEKHQLDGRTVLGSPSALARWLTRGDETGVASADGHTVPALPPWL